MKNLALHEPTPWERWHPAGETAERSTPAGRDAGAPRFKVFIHVHFLENIPTHEPLHFAIRGRRTSATDEDDFTDPVAALSSSSSSLALRPSMATNSTPTYVPGPTERGTWSQFMSNFWKTFFSMNRLGSTFRSVLEFGQSKGAERRKTLAQGVSRGISGARRASPGGAIENVAMSRHPVALPPLTGLTSCANAIPRLTPWAKVWRRSAALLTA